MLSLFMVYYDFKWYGEGVVPVPFVSVVVTTIIAFIYIIGKHFAQKKTLEFTKEFRIVLLFFFAIQISVLGLYFNKPTYEKVLQFLKTDAHLLFYVLFVFVIIRLLDRASLQKLLKFYYICGIVLAILGMLQFIHLNLNNITGFDQLLFGSKELYNTGISRVSAVFNEPSWFAYFLLDWMGIGLWYSLIRQQSKVWIFILPLLITLFFCASLGGYIGFLVLLFLCFLEFTVIRSKLYLVAFVSLILVLFSTSTSHFFVTSLASRITDVASGFDPSMGMRMDSVQAALKVWLIDPLFGVGIGNASFYTPAFYEGLWLYYIDSSAFHIAVDSVYLLILAESGIIGFVAFIIMIVVIIKQPLTMKPLYHILNTQSPIAVNNKGSLPNQDLWILTRIFRIIVIRNFIELIMVGSFLFPRLWFNIAIYLFLKGRIRKEFRDSLVFLTQ
jgi:O-antigen ligase